MKKTNKVLIIFIIFTLTIILTSDSALCNNNLGKTSNIPAKLTIVKAMPNEYRVGDTFSLTVKSSNVKTNVQYRVSIISDGKRNELYSKKTKYFCSPIGGNQTKTISLVTPTTDNNLTIIVYAKATNSPKLYDSFATFRLNIRATKINIIDSPADEYQPGDPVQVTVNTDNPKEKVQYRVVMTNAGRQKELYSKEKSYFGPQVSGKLPSILTMKAFGIGPVRMIVYVKTIHSKKPYDDYVIFNFTCT